MEFIADGLLIAAAGTAALYCWILSRRLTALKDLDKGLGGAIASLSAQVDETRASLSAAKAATRDQSREMQDLTKRAETAAAKLELVLAAIQETNKASSGSTKTTAGTPGKRKERARGQASAQPASASPAGPQLPDFTSAGVADVAPSRVASRPAERVEKPAAAGKQDVRGAGAEKSALITRLRGLAQVSPT